MNDFRLFVSGYLLFSTKNNANKIYRLCTPKSLKYLFVQQKKKLYFKIKKKTTIVKLLKYTISFCSAGVGRTGTFIAIDALVQYGLEKGTVNVTKYVSAMRRDRMHMIQTSVKRIIFEKRNSQFVVF